MNTFKIILSTVLLTSVGFAAHAAPVVSENIRTLVQGKSVLSELEDILVPIAFFVFLLCTILGRRYFSSRNEERRLEVLKLMVEKGQPIADSVVNQILNSEKSVEDSQTHNTYKRTRNAYGFTVTGLGLIGYAAINHDWHNTGLAGLIILCVGIGGLAGLYLPKSNEKSAN